MPFSKLPLLKEPLGSEDKIGSDPETMDRMLDLELGTVHELNKLAPGMWLFPKNPEHCCIYSKIGDNSKFRHFTDLVRLVSVETLPPHAQGKRHPIEHMYNADKLDSGGVKFEAVEEEFSLYVRFEKGCLKMPCLSVDDQVEMTLRNVMALEQCHYPFNAHVCNYVIFLNYLIDTHKDVDLLVKKGIIKNWIGQPGLVAEMVNKLCLGILEGGSYYWDIAVEVNAHYSNLVNRSRECAHECTRRPLPPPRFYC